MSEPAHARHTLDDIEIGVTDLGTAKVFYGSAFGSTFTDHGPGPDHVGIQGRDGGEVDGFRLDPPRWCREARSSCCTRRTSRRASTPYAPRAGR